MWVLEYYIHEWQLQGWEPTGATREGPLGTELHELRRADDEPDA